MITLFNLPFQLVVGSNEFSLIRIMGQFKYSIFLVDIIIIKPPYMFIQKDSK